MKSVEDNYIVNESNDGSYFLVLNTRIDDSSLSPNAVRLYMHIQRTRQDGKYRTVYETIEEIARKCHMSVEDVVSAEKELIDNGYNADMKRI